MPRISPGQLPGHATGRGASIRAIPLPGMAQPYAEGVLDERVAAA